MEIESWITQKIIIQAAEPGGQLPLFEKCFADNEVETVCRSKGIHTAAWLVVAFAVRFHGA